MSEPQGKHVCCWERENPHRCILCCQCGKKADKPFDAHLLSPSETAAVEHVAYTVDFDRKYWFIRREPAVIAGGFDTREQAATWLKDFLAEKKICAASPEGGAK